MLRKSEFFISDCRRRIASIFYKINFDGVSVKLIVSNIASRTRLSGVFPINFLLLQILHHHRHSVVRSILFSHENPLLSIFFMHTHV